MGAVFSEAQTAVEKADAQSAKEALVLSRDLSPWKAEHLFAVSKDVPEHEMVQLTGDFVTKVFEGPFKDAKSCYDEMLAAAKAKGAEAEEVYFFLHHLP